MIRAYDPSAVEKKWQQKWEEAKLHEADLKKAKDPFYSLVMFATGAALAWWWAPAGGRKGGE